MKQKVDENNKLEGTIQIDLNQGPFFGSAENKGVYVVVINVGWNDNQLVIESAFQKNTFSNTEHSNRHGNEIECNNPVNALTTNSQEIRRTLRMLRVWNHRKWRKVAVKRREKKSISTE